MDEVNDCKPWLEENHRDGKPSLLLLPMRPIKKEVIGNR